MAPAFEPARKRRRSLAFAACQTREHNPPFQEDRSAVGATKETFGVFSGGRGIVVLGAGLEPATPSSSGRCSTN